MRQTVVSDHGGAAPELVSPLLVSSRLVAFGDGCSLGGRSCNRVWYRISNLLYFHGVWDS